MCECVLDDVAYMLDSQFQFSAEFSLSPTAIYSMNTNGFLVYTIVIVWSEKVCGVDDDTIKFL